MTAAPAALPTRTTNPSSSSERTTSAPSFTSGPVPIEVPVEAIESNAEGTLARVRFAVGVAGDATVPSDRKLKAARGSVHGRADGSWWKRFFKG